MNRVYIFHHLIGLVAFLLILIHPITILLSYFLISPAVAGNLILSDWPVIFGVVALVLTIVLLALTIYINLEYDNWKITHKFLGVPLFFAAIHSWYVSGIFGTHPAVKLYVTVFYLLAIVAWIYRLFAARLGVNVYDYIVDKAIVKNDIIVLELAPVKKPLVFNPGQFAFIQLDHRGIAHQRHPFSIASSPSDASLTFAVKSLGDYTETLKLIEKGVKAKIEGPFGRFGDGFNKKKYQVWIGGGIGITPFISLSRSVSPADDVTVKFFYVVRDPAEAVFDEDIKDIVQSNPKLQYQLWISSKMGRFTAEKIQPANGDYIDTEYFICGPPPMMSSLRKQLREKNVPSLRIHTEEFSIK